VKNAVPRWTSGKLRGADRRRAAPPSGEGRAAGSPSSFPTTEPPTHAAAHRWEIGRRLDRGSPITSPVPRRSTAVSPARHPRRLWCARAGACHRLLQHRHAENRREVVAAWTNPNLNPVAARADGGSDCLQTPVGNVDPAAIRAAAVKLTPGSCADGPASCHRIGARPACVSYEINGSFSSSGARGVRTRQITRVMIASETRSPPDDADISPRRHPEMQSSPRSATLKARLAVVQQQRGETMAPGDCLRSARGMAREGSRKDTQGTRPGGSGRVLHRSVFGIRGGPRVWLKEQGAELTCAGGPPSASAGTA